MTGVSRHRDRDFTLSVTDLGNVAWIVNGRLAAFSKASGHAPGQTIYAQDTRRTSIPPQHRPEPGGNRRVTRLLREAKLKSSQACLEDVRYSGGRKLDKSLIAQLASWPVASGFVRIGI